MNEWEQLFAALPTEWLDEIESLQQALNAGRISQADYLFLVMLGAAKRA